MKLSRCITLLIAAAVLASSTAAFAQAPAAQPKRITLLPREKDSVDIYLFKEIDLPKGKIVRAWAAIDGQYQFVLYINGKEASKSRMGRIASIFRRAGEIENLAEFFKAGKNTLAVKAHRWSLTNDNDPSFILQAEVQIETADGIVKVPVVTDDTWVASHEAPNNWTSARFKARGWKAAKIIGGGLAGPRIPKDKRQIIAPDIPAPVAAAAKKMFPRIAEMSDWSQQIVVRDLKADTERLMEMYQTQFIADKIARAIQNPNRKMGDSYSVTGYIVGNGTTLTILGPTPWRNCGGILGPEYQYPHQWGPGSAFGGDALNITVDGKGVGLNDEWMWKIRKTNVMVVASKDPASGLVLYTITFAPPGMKALCRIYMPVNTGDTPLENVVIRNTNYRTKVDGKTLTDTVTRIPQTDAAGDTNERTIITGVLNDSQITTATRKQGNVNVGTLVIPFGDLAPGQAKRHMVYHVTFLKSRNGKPVPSTAAATLAKVKAGRYKLLDETIAYWRKYNDETTTLEAPGEWGTRVADFIDDVKVLVQVQQFERNGAVGPMWFFSDQWIRDACGPVRSFLRTGKIHNAKKSIDYHYKSAIACRKILNWVPMDVNFDDLKPVDDWSKITVSYADRKANREVPSWIILQHHWYFRFSGDTETIAEHWEYIKRCYYGQFDNELDKVFRPDFKIPFQGDETYIYSGGEGLWENRYDMKQNSYPGGNIYSADSSFELVAAGDALVEMGTAIGKTEDVKKIAEVNARIRQATEKFYWMEDMGFYAQGMSTLFDGQLNRYPMANILANVIWSGYGKATDRKTISNAERMAEYLMEESGVVNPIVDYDVTVGMLQGQGLYTMAAINHPWAEKAFYALMQIAGDTTEFAEWMAPGADYRTMYRANRIRPWEAGINLDATLFYLTGFEPDAFNKKFTITPRIPTGVYSPIKWDSMKFSHLPMGEGNFDLDINDTAKGGNRVRTYTVTSNSKDSVSVTLNALIPFAQIEQVKVDGKKIKADESKPFGQAMATTTATLPAGKTLVVAVTYEPKKVKPYKLDIKPFVPTQPTFEESDVVVFTALRPVKNSKRLREVLAEKYKVLALDASLPTDAATFEAALLTKTGLRTKILIFNERTMSLQRKASFWWDPRFDDVMGKFIRRGGVVLEINSGNISSKWLKKTLGDSTFSVNYYRGGNALALDKPNSKLDKDFFWLDEKQAQQCGKWSGYWAGQYTMKYFGSDTPITDTALIWGEQEQKHGCMQYTMKTEPGKDHLIRIRSWPYTKKGFTLQVFDKETKKWKVIQTVWVKAPEGAKPNANYFVDVFLELPKKYVSSGKQTVFRIGAPKGSFGGIGAAPERLNSTAASRIWIRPGLTRPPSMADVKTSSPLAGKLGLPGKGIIGYAGGRITFDGFTAPYRMLGDSKKAAVILKPIGKGIYVKSEMTSLFPVEHYQKLIDTLIDSGTRRQAIR